MRENPFGVPGGILSFRPHSSTYNTTMSRRVAVPVVVLALCLLVAGVASAHDMWLRPASFRLAPGDTLIVHQLVDAELEAAREVELLRLMTPRFELMTGDSTIDLLRHLPDMREQPVIRPVLRRVLHTEGPALLAMTHAFIHTQFTTSAFEDYLEHEAYEVEEFRDQMGDKAVHTERYGRTFKSLVQIGESAGGDLHARVVGQKLEILLLQNPYLLDPGDSLHVQVLFEGRPLAGQRVTAFNGEGEQRRSISHGRTNSDGVVRFALDREGFWLIRLLHLYPAPVEDVDWESYWASYTFWLD